MESLEYRALLFEGVPTWNDWRSRTDVVPDLSGMNLSGMELDDANFTGVKFVYVNLSDTKLHKARLAGANLTGAKLRRAELMGADIHGANLREADLREARLARANLSGAECKGALLFEADLSEANLQSVTNLRLDSNYLRDAQLSPYATDRWSILRRSYSGSRLLFHLVLLIAFIAPYLVRVLTWNTVNEIQETGIGLRDELLGVIERSNDQHPLRSQAVQITLRALRELKPCLAKDCRETPVWRILLGGSGAWYRWFIPLCVILYNIGRGLLIWTVGALRDEEERSGCTPPYHGIQGYAYLIWAHRAVQILLFANLVSLMAHFGTWLFRPVWLPQ